MRRLCFLMVLLLGAAAPSLPAQEVQEDLQRAIRAVGAGEYDEAWEIVQESESPDPLRLRLMIELLDREGRRSEAEAVARDLLRRFQGGLYGVPTTAYQAAFAAWRLQRWEEANQIYIEISQLEGVPFSLYVDWGNLYLEKFNPAEAETIYREGLAIEARTASDRWSRADLYLGLSQSLSDQSKPGGDEALEEAAELDPSHLGVATRKVRRAIESGNWDEARQEMDRWRDAAESYLPLLELRTAWSYFREDREAFEDRLEDLLDLNPNNARFYEVLADLCIIKRRLEEAIDHYQTALELQPDRWSALASMGINLLRLGREDEGIAALERAYENDPYNIWTVNTLRLVDSFEDFDRFETENFSIKLHREESGALRPYIESLLARSLQTLERKYGHEVDHKVVFEMYPDHEDFAVRALGLPGLGALGATIGRVVAMDSPSARPRGEFHWASTLWHEMAHVVTLSLSDHRVPRWFTEGLSMMEERLGGRGWGDDLSLGFVEFYREDNLLPLSDLNSGFVRPDSPQRISISYFQAGWVCEVIAEEFGPEKLPRMLEAYAEGKTTEEVFESVLEASVEEVDALFQENLAVHLDPLLGPLERPEALPRELDELRQAHGTEPENYYLNLALGRRLQEEGESAEAIPYLEKAMALFPWEAGEGSPYPVLVDALRETDSEDRALEVFSEWWSRWPMKVENALELADLFSVRNRSEDAARVLDEAIYADPLSDDLHRRLGELLLARGDYAGAAREFRVQLHLDPVDRATAYYQLARANWGLEDREAARRNVLLALEIAPGFSDAQKLLLEVVRP